MARKLYKILVIDVESTCWDGPPPSGEEHEIIEVGVALVDTSTLTIEKNTSFFVKPQKSMVSQFCTELTTIKAEDVAQGVSFEEACRILRKEYDAKNITFASWGDYDRRQFQRQCASTGVSYPFGPTHLNVKNLFGLARGLPHETGMDGALRHLGMELEGTHHRGLDDAKNIARILIKILQDFR